MDGIGKHLAQIQSLFNSVLFGLLFIYSIRIILAISGIIQKC